MHDVDVVVMGAGVSGLVAARELVKAGKSVRVLEARGRVAGRTDHHVFANGDVIEMGSAKLSMLSMKFSMDGSTAVARKN